MLKQEEERLISFIKSTLKGNIRKGRAGYKIRLKRHRQWMAVLAASRKEAKISSIQRDFADSVVMLLVTETEDYFARLVRYIYENDKHILITNKEVTYEDVIKSKNFKNLFRLMVDREINQLLKNGIDKLFDWLNSRNIQIDIKNYTKRLPEFHEIFLRRHLFVHNEGYVDDEYIAKARKYGFYNNKIKKGTKLKADDSYIQNAFNVLVEVAATIGFCVMLNLDRNDSELQSALISDYSYELLKLNKNEPAKYFIQYLISQKNRLKLKPETITVAYINLAIANKQLGNIKESREIANKILSHKPNDRFLMAVLILLNKRKQALILLKQLGKTINKEGYHDWPLFKELRETTAFQNIYKSIYKEELKYKPVEKFLKS